MEATIKEGKLIKLIFDYFHLQRGCHVRRMNTGAYKKGKNWIVYGETGQPDIEILVGPYNIVVGVETKSDEMKVHKKGKNIGELYHYRGTHEPEQIAYEKYMTRKVGYNYVLAYSLDPVIAAVDAVRKLKLKCD